MTLALEFASHSVRSIVLARNQTTTRNDLRNPRPRFANISAVIFSTCGLT
jgi:hypothetical protein